MTPLLLANAVSTLFMTGLIWFVQIVHYPLFAAVGNEGFPAYSRSHQALTTFVVGPPMLIEAVSALLLVAVRPAGVAPWMCWAGVGLVAAIWLSTASLQIPAHARLAGGFDPAVADALVSSNWIRTAAWTLRAALVCLMLWQAARPANG
jgi:hypothetical protein